MPTRTLASRAKRPYKLASKKTRATKKAAAKRVPKLKIKIIGKVVHFYDRIGVAIVELNAPLSLGDTVTFKHGEWTHTQKVTSMQKDHAPLQKAKKGNVVGVLTSVPIPDKTFVIPA